MSEKKPQTLANHGRTDPWMHYFVFVVLTANFLVCIVHAYHDHRRFNLWLVLMSIALIVLAFKVRLYALKVQDRVIRLEERLRLSALLPEELRRRIPELTEAQLVALRFASDEEVSALAERTLREGLSQKQIKQAVQVWRPDYWRV